METNFQTCLSRQKSPSDLPLGGLFLSTTPIVPEPKKISQYVSLSITSRAQG